MAPYPPEDDVIEDEDEQGPTGEVEPGTVEYGTFAEFARLTAEHRKLKDRVKELNQQLETMSYQLRDYLTSRGWKGLEAGGYWIHLKRDVFVRAQDGMNQEIVCSVLKQNGMGQFVKEQYSTGSMTGHIRGLEQRHAEDLASGRLESVKNLLPPEVCAVLNFDPKYEVVAQRRQGKAAMDIRPASERRYITPKFRTRT